MASRWTLQKDLDFPSLDFQHTADKTNFAVIHHVSSKPLSSLRHFFSSWISTIFCMLSYYYYPSMPWACRSQSFNCSVVTPPPAAGRRTFYSYFDWLKSTKRTNGRINQTRILTKVFSTRRCAGNYESVPLSRHSRTLTEEH